MVDEKRLSVIPQLQKIFTLILLISMRVERTYLIDNLTDHLKGKTCILTVANTHKLTTQSSFQYRY
jgi:hypothetical protein